MKKNEFNNFEILILKNLLEEVKERFAKKIATKADLIRNLELIQDLDFTKEIKEIETELKELKTNYNNINQIYNKLK